MSNFYFVALDCFRGIIYVGVLRLLFLFKIRTRGLVMFGRGVVIRVGRRAQLVFGARVRFRGNAYISVSSGQIVLGDNVFFNTGCVVTAHESIVIGDAATFGPNVVIVDHDHRKPNQMPEAPPGGAEFVSTPVRIGKRAWVGANSVILRGSVIGDGAIIGAGSVVRGNVPAGCVYVSQGESRLIGRD